MNIAVTDTMQQGLSFLLKQLEYIEPQVYQIQYPEIVYPELVPIDASAPEWINTISYYSMDLTGRPKWASGSATDIPFADVLRDRNETTVEMATIGYKYSIEEINKARANGINLSADKAMAAREAYERYMDDLAFVGDASKGFAGLFNNAAVTAANVPADGTGSTTTWSTKTPDLILRDVNAVLTGIWSGTLGIEMADTLLLPLESFSEIATRRVDANSTMTILAWIRENNIYTATTGRPLTIRSNRRLSTLGSGGTRRMMAYRRSPDVVKMHVPMRLSFLAPQLNLLQYVVPGMFRTGGVEIRRPGAARYADGI
jgi:hypothetical protein